MNFFRSEEEIAKNKASDLKIATEIYNRLKEVGFNDLALEYKRRSLEMHGLDIPNKNE